MVLNQSGETINKNNMTLEQAIKKILDKQSQVKQLEKEILDTKRELKNLTPYKVGDLVKVDNKYEVYVSDVQWYWCNSYYEYKFTKPKKDGTMGQQGSGIYSYNKVELIKRAGE